MLSTGLLMQGQIFTDSHRRCAMREGGEDGHFWCKKDIGRTLLSYYCTSVSNSLEEQELRSVDSLPNWLLGWHVWWAVA